MDAATAGIVGSISGAIIGALIAWLAAVFVLRKQERYKAGAEFVCAFIELQRLLKIRHPNHSSEYRSTYSLLEDNYVNLFRAVLRYKQSLSVSNSEKLEEKWNEICTFNKDHQMPTFKEYEVKDSNHESEMKVRDKALSRIQNLLDMAKVK